MNWHDVRLRLRALIFRKQVEEELSEELNLHIELQIRKNINQGLDEAEARRHALVKFGRPTYFAEECRYERRVSVIEHLIQDVRYACRMFRNNLAFTLVAVLLLALGIGATSTVYSLAYWVIQDTLPVENADELIELGYDDPMRGFLTGFSNPGFQMFVKENQVFSEMFAFTDTFKLDVTRKGTAEFAEVVFQTTNMYTALGLRPALGRLINDGDGQPAGGTPGAVLSFRYWQKRFGGDPNVIGETIAINNTAFAVIGVAPSVFQGLILGTSPDVILALPIVESVRRVPVLNNGASLGLHLIGKRKPGLTLEEIRLALNPLYKTFVDHAISSFPPAFAGGITAASSKWQFRVQEARWGANSEVRADLRESLTILLSITALVLLIGCTNLAGLLITRTESRMRELSTRLAVGCSRERLMRQLLTESMLLAATGGLFGFAISLAGRPLLLNLLTSRAASIEIGLNFSTAVIAGALSLVAGLCLGVAPVVTAVRISRGSFAVGLSRYWWWNGRRVLLVSQVAASLVLLVVAAQFAFSLQNYRNVFPGFRPDHLVLFDVSVRARTITYARELRRRLANVPGVVAVSHSLSAVGQMNWTTPIQVPGFQASSPGGNFTGRNIVGPSFAETLGLELVRGRDIEIGDTRDKPSVAVVNEAFAATYFSRQDPVGRAFFFVDSMDRPHTIVGVVKNARDRGLKNRVAPMAYSSFEHDALGGLTFAVRVSRMPEDVMPEIASVVRGLDASVPMGQMRSMNDQIDESLLRERMLASLSSVFSGLAAIVAAIGIYGMLAYVVSRRSREIAVRIAVGARPSQVRWLALKESVLLILSGTAIGIPLSLMMSAAVQHQLFGIESDDPRSIVLAVASVLILATAASWSPATRASRVDPVATLKVE